MAHTLSLASPMPPPSRLPPAAGAAQRWRRNRLTAALDRAGGCIASSSSRLHDEQRPPWLPSRGGGSSFTLSAARESSGRRVSGNACAAATRAGMPRASPPRAHRVAAARRHGNVLHRRSANAKCCIAGKNTCCGGSGCGGRVRRLARNSAGQRRRGHRARRHGGGEWPRDGSSMLESVGFGARGAHNGAHIGEIARENPPGSV